MDEVEWFSYPRTSAHPRCKVSYQATELTFISLLYPCFVEASTMVKKSISCQKVDQPIASLLSFCNVRHMQYTNFLLQVTDRCEQGYEWECVKLCYRMSWCLKHIRMITAQLSGPSFNSLHKNLAWWVVKWRTSKKNTKLSKLGDGHEPRTVVQYTYKYTRQT